MPKPFRVTFFLAGCVFLAACAAATPQITATAFPSATPPPTETQTTIPTEPVMPTAGVQVTDTPDIFTELDPVSPPLKEWNGVPIPPDALAGGGGQTSYYFTTKATVDAIHAFYDQALPKVGFTPLAVGNGSANTVVLFYQGSGQASDASLSISLFIKGDTVLVMIVKN
jgi:hypothetical protein